VVRNRVDYNGIANWIESEGIISDSRLRERIISDGNCSYAFIVRTIRDKHNIISVRKFRPNTKRYNTFFIRDKSLSEECTQWIELTYGPLLDVDSMVATLERHGYEKKEEDYRGEPRTYRITDHGSLGSSINWCEPCGRSNPSSVSESGIEEELTGCEDCIQQEKKEKYSRTMSIEKLYASVEAQYARDLKTMGREGANWWRA